MRTNPLRLLLVALLLGALSYLGLDLYAESKDPWRKKARLESADRMAQLAQAPVTLADWPPVVGQRFPEVAFYDHEGQSFNLQLLRGKPVLLEFVAMSCAGCQAFSGGNTHGGFEGFAVQSDLQAIEEYLPRFSAGLRLDDAGFSFVQIIIYNLALRAPSARELAAWRAHFQFDNHANTFILAGGEALANQASFKMIPGFMLLDSELKVLFDSTGHQPRHNLYRELLPALGGLLRPGLGR